MNGSQSPIPEASPCIELADLVLAGGEPVANFVKVLGTAYEITGKPPSRWISQVIKRGIIAGASLELMLWLVERDLTERQVAPALGETRSFMTGLYAEQRAIFDERGFFIGM